MLMSCLNIFLIVRNYIQLLLHSEYVISYETWADNPVQKVLLKPILFQLFLHQYIPKYAESTCRKKHCNIGVCPFTILHSECNRINLVKFLQIWPLNIPNNRKYENQNIITNFISHQQTSYSTCSITTCSITNS